MDESSFNYQIIEFGESWVTVFTAFKLWQATHLGGRNATSKRKFIGRTRTLFSLIKEECFIKNKKLSIRITESDLQKIHHKANKAQMSFTDYVTKACLGKQIFVIDGLEEVIHQQKAIGRNLNQLTTLCNMGKVNVIYLSELTNQYAEVNKLLTSLLDRKRWSV